MTIEQIIEQAIEKAIAKVATKSRTFNDQHLALTLEQVVNMTGVKMCKVREWTRRKDFPCFKDGKSYIVPTQQLIEWLEGQCMHWRKTS